jgi:Tfp pilus assembly protein PilO
VIVARTPLKLFDVDVVGLVVLGVVGAAAWWLVIAPWQRLWGDYRTLSAAHAEVRSGLEHDILELERFQKGLAELERVVVEEIGEVPGEDAFPQLLRQMTDVAKASNIEVLNVKPQPATRVGGYMISDIDVGGRGSSHDFIRFLDRLAQVNPFQSLESCALSNTPGASDQACELTWTVRMYLLPNSPAPRTGDGS